MARTIRKLATDRSPDTRLSEDDVEVKVVHGRILEDGLDNRSATFDRFGCDVLASEPTPWCIFDFDFRKVEDSGSIETRCVVVHVSKGEVVHIHANIKARSGSSILERHSSRPHGTLDILVEGCHGLIIVKSCGKALDELATNGTKNRRGRATQVGIDVVQILLIYLQNGMMRNVVNNLEGMHECDIIPRTYRAFHDSCREILRNGDATFSVRLHGLDEWGKVDNHIAVFINGAKVNVHGGRGKAFNIGGDAGTAIVNGHQCRPRGIFDTFEWSDLVASGQNNFEFYFSFVVPVIIVVLGRGRVAALLRLGEVAIIGLGERSSKVCSIHASHDEGGHNCDESISGKRELHDGV